ncbi:MAG: 2-C-methyl-D-erythritol 4-phosphate cytidylyltransferase [Capsulimonadaceae bacterium]
MGNKVLAHLCGRPVLRWTVDAFAAHGEVDGIVVVTGQRDVQVCREILSGADKLLSIVAGGRTRQESVYIGLSMLAGDPDAFVMVHDGARPLIDSGTISRCLAAARDLGNAVAALPVSDTLKSADSGQVVRETVDRRGLWAVQTPQVFRWSSLAAAHLAAQESAFAGTDDASLVEFLGRERVNLVDGSAENIKITLPADARIAEALLSDRAGLTLPHPLSKEMGAPLSVLNPMDGMRVGFGYDIHRFAVGRRLFLGGVEFDPVDGCGLEGHSDADVLLHAVCDALLGAAAQPDIGCLFPNTDPDYVGISSLELLARVKERLAGLGYGILNIDVTVIAERPKIGPRVAHMRAVVADTLGISPDRVGIKATTNEGLGAVGEGMGIAAHAVASVLRSSMVRS